MPDALLSPWVAFFGVVIILFAIDLRWGSRGTNLRAAALWAAVWVGAGLAFGLWVLASQGSTAATD